MLCDVGKKLGLYLYCASLLKAFTFSFHSFTLLSVVYCRCIPEGVARQDLIDHLSRLTIHLDSELRG